jgi:3-oxoadipate enol-lactonase
MSHLDIDNTRFFYQCNGKGTPLVLIAGYSCDHTFWNGIIDELARHFKVITFDNRGIGQTNNTLTPLSITSMAQDTIQLIRALELKKPIILGQSMGGTIAQTIAHLYGDEIQKLIVLNSSAQLNARTLMILDALLVMFKEHAAFDMLMDTSIPWFYSPQFLSEPKNVAALKEMAANNPFPPTPQLLTQQLTALQQFNSLPWIKDINVPTLVIASEDDIVCLPTESQYLAKQIKQAQFIMIKGGHSSPVDNPRELMKVIIEN